MDDERNVFEAPNAPADETGAKRHRAWSVSSGSWVNLVVILFPIVLGLLLVAIFQILAWWR